MKKIGIITFQNADNYGALLQAYALKKILQQDHSVHILNYLSPQLEQDYKIIKWPKPIFKEIIRQTVHLVMAPYKLYIRSQFASFRRKYLQDMSPLFSQQLPNLSSQYDLFISGSDQVFNPRITNFDPNYFLAFNKDISKNYSYAASFGLQLENFTEQECAFIKKNLGHFHDISVREVQGLHIVQTLTGCSADVHLDPTLLLPETQWQPLSINPRYSRYVLLYLMYKDKELIAFAKKLAQAKHCQLLYISPSLDIKNHIPARHITPTPQEWLGLFLNASYVVTNSFHGLAFSINFNKDFFLGKLPSTWLVNSRLDNLLNITDLHHRLYTQFTDNYDVSIDWAAVNTKLDQERKKAFAYLREITK